MHCIINGILTHKQNSRHPGSELPSSRLASLACYAVAGRFATSSLYMPHSSPSLSLRQLGLHFIFYL